MKTKKRNYLKEYMAIFDNEESEPLTIISKIVLLENDPFTNKEKLFLWDFLCGKFHWEPKQRMKAYKTIVEANNRLRK